MAIFFSRPLTLTIISFGICVKPSPECYVPRAPRLKKATWRWPDVLVGEPAQVRACSARSRSGWHFSAGRVSGERVVRRMAARSPRGRVCAQGRPGLQRLRVPLGRGGAFLPPPRGTVLNCSLGNSVRRQPPRRAGPVEDAPKRRPVCVALSNTFERGSRRVPFDESTPGLRSPPGQRARALRHRTLPVPPLRRLVKTFQTGAMRARAKLPPRRAAPQESFLSTRKAREAVRKCFHVRAPCRKVLSSGSEDRHEQYKRVRGEKASRRGRQK